MLRLLPLIIAMVSCTAMSEDKTYYHSCEYSDSEYNKEITMLMKYREEKLSHKNYLDTRSSVLTRNKRSYLC